MADYKYTDESSTGVFRYADGAGIPADTGNADYRQYLAYVDGGGLTDPYRTDEEQAEANASAAMSEQTVALKQLFDNDVKVSQGLPPLLTPEGEQDINNHVQLLQGDIDHPTADDTYTPPLPPSVTPPAYDSLTATVTRVPGWNDVLGYRFVINSKDPEFEPGVLSMAVYTNENCQDYLYTTGAFQWDTVEEEWYAVCPAGQETYLSAINFGMLHASTPIKCFTLPEGVMEKTFNVCV